MKLCLFSIRNRLSFHGTKYILILIVKFIAITCPLISYPGVTGSVLRGRSGYNELPMAHPSRKNSRKGAIPLTMMPVTCESNTLEN